MTTPGPESAAPQSEGAHETQPCGVAFAHCWRSRARYGRRPLWLLLPVGVMVLRLLATRRSAQRAPRMQANFVVDVHPTATIAFSMFQPATLTVGPGRFFRRFRGWHHRA